MNELDQYDFQKSLDFVSPIQKMIQFIVAALIFASFHFNFLFFATLGNIISTVLFFLGLRLVRKANKAFHYAYIISVFYLIFSIVEAMILITPFSIPMELELVISFLALLRVILICQGLNSFLKEGVNATQVSVYYMFLYGLGYLGMVIPELIIIFIIVYIILFVLMIKALLACKRDMLDYGYKITLSPIRVNTVKFVIGYIVITLIMVTGCQFIYPFVTSQPQEIEIPDYSQYPLVSEYQDEFSALKVYDYDESHYYYVYQIKTEHLNKPIKSVQLELSHYLATETLYQIKDMFITDGTLTYPMEVKENQTAEDILFLSVINTNYYVSYLKPNFDKSYIIQFAILSYKKITTEDPDDPDQRTDFTWASDVINISYSYYDKLLILNKNDYSLKQQITYSIEEGKVVNIDYIGYNLE